MQKENKQKSETEEKNKEKRNKEALHVLQKLHRKNPSDKKIEEALNNAKAKEDEALGVLEKLSKEDLKAFVALSNMKFQEVNGEKSEALDALEKLSDDNSEAAKEAAKTLLARHNWEALPTLSYLQKEKYKDEIEKSEPASGDLKKICKKIYQAKSIQSFLECIDIQFKEKYKELTASSERLPPLPPSHQQSNKKPQIEGTFTVDVKKNDDSDRSNEKPQK
jgi:arsenate reductase-like glutaredoxin family protein